MNGAVGIAIDSKTCRMLGHPPTWSCVICSTPDAPLRSIWRDIDNEPVDACPCGSDSGRNAYVHMCETCIELGRNEGCHNEAAVRAWELIDAGGQQGGQQGPDSQPST